MKTQLVAFAALAAFFATAFCQSDQQIERLSSKPRATTLAPAVAANYGKLPLSFEANQGQADPRVKFLSHGDGYSLLLTDTAAVLELSEPDLSSLRPPTPKTIGANSSAHATMRRPATLKTDVVRMELWGAAHNSPIIGSGQLAGKSNYFVGRDSAKWHTNIPTYAKVKYNGVYPGIDLVYYGNQRQLEYDFIVAPGASAKPVKLHFAGAIQLKLNSNGDLAVLTQNGAVAFHKPIVYQKKDWQRQSVEGKFVLLARNTVGFELGDYDRSRDLVIDPVLAYSTYLPSVALVAVDHYGNAYTVMLGPLATGRPVQPTYGAYQNGEGMQVTKLDPAGTTAVYTAFFGGIPYWQQPSIVVDDSGNAYITGATTSPDFPVTPGAFQTVLDGYSNAFVTKLNPSGSGLAYSTLLGGSVIDAGTSIAVDSAGIVYLAGATESPDFPVTPGSFQRVNKSFGSGICGFASKLNSTGSALVYSTLLGGSGISEPAKIAVDAAGSAYLTGFAESLSGSYESDFPVTPGAFETSTGKYYGFAAKLNATASALVYSTYFPAGGVAVDGAGDAYIVGVLANGATFPATSGAFQKTPRDHESVSFVSKLNPSGSALVYSTYLGGSTGSTGSHASGVAVDKAGNAYVIGSTSDSDFPITSDAFQKVNKGEYQNVFVTELNAAGSALIYSTYLGGSDSDFPASLALDGLDNVYVAGAAGSSDFPVTPGAYGNHLAGNGFASKFAFHGGTSTTLTSDSNPAPADSNITFVAQVAGVDNSATPGGLVEFHIDRTFEAATPLDDTGQASYATAALQPGTHTIEALYRGGSNYSSSSGFVTQTTTGQVASPDIVPVSGTYHSAQQATISDTTTNAVIHYTTDGSAPSSSSPVYTAPIPIAAATTLRALATAAGDTQSAIASANYKISSTIKPVSVTFAPSAITLTYGEPLSLTASVKTTDGTTATGSITFLHGNVPIGRASLSGGTATLTAPSLEPGQYSLTANYGGSATETAMQSAAVVVEVSP